MPAHSAIATLGSRFPRRRAVITGAASGLGRELARQLAGGGWRLGLLDLDAAGLEDSARETAALGGEPWTRTLDVTDAGAMETALRDFAALHEGLDVMINNAGVAAGGRFGEIPLADWQWLFGINLMGVVHGCRAALAVMPAAQPGLILNVASAAGFMASPMMSAYNASKAAVLSLSETLHGELLDTPLQVSVALPAFFPTGLLARLRAPEAERESARLLMQHSDYSAEQAAADILAAAAAGDFYIFAPARLKLLWRFKRFLPLHYLRRFPRLREKRLAALRARAPGGSA